MTVLNNLNTLDFTELFTNEEVALKFAYEYDLLYDDGVCVNQRHTALATTE